MRLMPRPAAGVAVLLSVLLAGCGGSDAESGSPEAAAEQSAAAGTPSPSGPPRALDKASLAGLLPGEEEVEKALGGDLDAETKEDLTQLHEGATVAAESGQVRFYRASDGSQSSGGYVALSLFATEDDAKRFLATNPSFGAKPTPDPDSGVLRSFDLDGVADAGHGTVYLEPGDTDPRTLVTGRLGRVVIEVVLFHGPDDDVADEARSIVAGVRSRMG